LGRLADDPATPPTVLVTHHVEEVPPGFTHALLLRRGRVLAAGAIGDVLTAEALSAAFGLALEVDRRDGRYTARAVTERPGPAGGAWTD
jgi:iron complex transport system ATP-binding protein